MPKSIPSAKRLQALRYRPLVEQLEGREAPGNTVLGPGGIASPTLGLGMTGLSATNSPLIGEAPSGSFGGSATLYSGFALSGAPGAEPGGFALSSAPATPSGQPSATSALELYVGGEPAGGGMGAPAGYTGDGGAGFGGGSIAGGGLSTGGGFVGGGASGGSSGSQDLLTQMAMINEQSLTPANSIVGLTNAFIQTRGTESFWAVELRPGVDPGLFAASVGAVNFGKGGMDTPYNLLRFPEGALAKSINQALLTHPFVLNATQITSSAVKSLAVPNDPLFQFQWHLRNTAQFGGLAGADANVVPVWDTIRGRGVTIGIIDSGVEYTHEDIAPNYSFADSFDVSEGDFNPWPRDDDDGRSHGTSVAGVAAGRGFNGIGITGAAPESQIANLKLIDGTGISIFQQAFANSYHRNIIDIYNNSWGKADPETIELSNPFMDQTLADGARFGRQGTGNIFLWSAGNSSLEGSTAWATERNNLPFVMTIGSLTESGLKAPYSEEGPNVFVSAYSNGGALGIVTATTENGYTFDFGGTSSAAPLVSGVVALMLEANPNLTWRDVQEIIARTSRKTNPSDPSWVTNGANYHFSDAYGFGAIDAKAAVDLARTWTNLPAQVNPYRTDVLLADPITGGPVTIPIAAPGAGFTRSAAIPQNFVIEHVTVGLVAEHPVGGELAFSLTSPSGTTMLVDPNFATEDEIFLPRYRFGFNGFRGETSQGTWTIKVRDTGDEDPTQPNYGLFYNWQLTITGYIPDGGVQPPVPPPAASDGSADKRFEPNNTAKTATQLGAFASNRIDVVNLRVASKTDIDWFRFTTTRPGQVQASIDITGNNILWIKMFVLNPKTKKLVEVARAQGTKLQAGGTQTVIANFSDGEQVFLAVQGRHGAVGNYNLRILG
jgi:subtilisin family serine protease